MRIIITNNKCQLDGPLRIMNEAFEAFKIRNPNAFYLRRFMQPGWDGKKPYISESGYFQTGLFPQVYDWLQTNHKKESIELIDNRGAKRKITRIKTIGNVDPRDYQSSGIDAVLDNYVGGIFFPRGIEKIATNGGKTIFAAGIYKSFRKPKTALLLKSKDLFDQALKELPELLGEDVGYISSKKILFRNFMVIMQGTALSRIHTLKTELASYEIVIVDECDEWDNKSGTKLLSHIFNAYVRIGMSGTALISTLAKHRLRNQNLKGYFGNLLFQISNRELIDKGHSSEVIVKIIKGNTKTTDAELTFPEEYEKFVVKNKQRNLQVIKRIRYNCIKKKRLPALIVVKNHAHVKRLYKLATQAFSETGWRIEWAHHKRKDREQLLTDFKDGKIDLLISSMIVKRGMNFKLMRYMCNAGGGEDPANPLQLLGRAMRKMDGITHKYYEDFWDEGRYLKKHSKHRRIYYKNEKLKVVDLYE